MKEEKEITLFVLGVEKEIKGRYLAKVLRTQYGIESVDFDFASRLLRITYDPLLTDVDAIKSFTYFSECAFISEEEEIKKHTLLLRKRLFLEKIMRFAVFLWICMFLCLIIRELIDKSEGTYIIYTGLSLVSVLLIGVYYLKRKIARRESHNKLEIE